MKVSSEVANFQLETTFVNFAANAPIEYTFSNVNMKNVLGDMFDKYKYFKIVINSVSGFAGSAATFTPVSNVFVGLSGLDWVSNTTNGSPSAIGKFHQIFTMPSNGSSFYNYPIEKGIIFRKSSVYNVDLKVSLYNSRTSNIVVSQTTGTVGFSFFFNFTIYGLSEDD